MFGGALVVDVSDFGHELMRFLRADVLWGSASPSAFANIGRVTVVP